jgi:hypothetical protein
MKKVHIEMMVILTGPVEMVQRMISSYKKPCKLPTVVGDKQKVFGKSTKR